MATLNVTIAGKEFPLTVDENTYDEVLEAAASINQKIQQHQQHFKVDVKDALAMCALEYAALNSQLQKQSNELQKAQAEIDTLLFTLQTAESV